MILSRMRERPCGSGSPRSAVEDERMNNDEEFKETPERFSDDSDHDETWFFRSSIPQVSLLSDKRSPYIEFHR
jgi:hypothetical protein